MYQRGRRWIALFVMSPVLMIGVMLTLLALGEPHKKSGFWFLIFAVPVGLWLVLFVWGCGVLIRAIWHRDANGTTNE